MPSAALQVWSGESAARINDLLHAHATVGGAGAGRRWRTEQLNWALVLLIAAEFQRYCRSLHDLAVDEMVTQTAQLNAVLAPSLRAIMTNRRELDRGNANPGNLGNDFGRLGMQFWPELQRVNMTVARRCSRHIEWLNTARNGLAHGDTVKLASVAAAGYPLQQLATVQKFHRATDSLAQLMDRTLASYLARVFGGPAPW
jgi:hypothetical protein